MKKNLHPQLREVVFQDMTNGEAFIIASTLNTTDTIQWSDGRTYPLVKVETSSRSHPVYTGKLREDKLSSRASEFNQKYNRE